MRIALVIFTAAISAAVLGACGNGTGGLCQMTSECQSGLVCLARHAPGTDGGADRDVRLCMRPCDDDAGAGNGDEHLCVDGRACLTLEGMRVCYPGGSRPIHSACANDLECESGTVCAPDTNTCTQACTVGGDIPCNGTETCVAIGGGICRAPMIVPDAGT